METGACPWDGFSRPVIDFCERNLCGWVVEPANAISSLAFVVSGIYLIRLAKRDGTKGFLSLTGVFAILIGVFSALFHASMTLWGNFLDLTSMNLLGAMLVAINIGRLYPPLRRQRLNIYMLLVGTCSGALLVDNRLGVSLFAGLISVFVVLELILLQRSRRSGERIRHTYFWATAAIFLSSYLGWNLDLHGVVCDPDNHWLQVHSLWHVGTAFAMITIYRYFSQFKLAKKE